MIQPNKEEKLSQVEMQKQLDQASQQNQLLMEMTNLQDKAYYRMKQLSQQVELQKILSEIVKELKELKISFVRFSEK